jgi:hypothetical protein
MNCSRKAGGCGHEFCWLCGQPCTGGTHFTSGACLAARNARVGGRELWLNYHDEDGGGALKVPVPAMAATPQATTATPDPAPAPTDVAVVPATAATAAVP